MKKRQFFHPPPPPQPIAFIALISVVIEVDPVPQSKVNTYVWEGF